MEKKIWRIAFDAYDLNGDGVIDKTEFKAALTKIIKIEISDKQIDRIFSRIDLNDAGVIGYEQFESLMTKPLKPFSEEEKVVLMPALTEVISRDEELEQSLEEPKVSSSFSSQTVEKNEIERSDNVTHNPEETKSGEQLDNQDHRECNSWRIAFNEYDIDNDGVLSRREFKIALERATRKLVPKAQAESLFAKADLKSDGVIDYAEFEVLLQDRNNVFRKRINDQY